MNRGRGSVAPVAAGALLAFFAYPPFHFLGPAFVFLVPALVLIKRTAASERPFRNAIMAGFAYGTVTNTLVMYWVAAALWRLNPPSVVAFLPLLLMLGLYQGALFSFVGWAELNGRLPLAVSFPVAWTAMEWVLAHQYTLAMPWLGPGVTLTGFPALVQVADLIGSRGVGFLVVAANVAVYKALTRPRRAAGPLVALAGGLGLLVAYGAYRFNTLDTNEVGSAALVQPATGVKESRDPARWDGLVDRLVGQTRDETARSRSDIVVWPETALPDNPVDHPGWERRLDSLAAHRASTLISGIFERGRDGVSLNSVAVFRGGFRGERRVYSKRFLVPLIERRSLLPGPVSSGFRPGKTPATAETPVGRVGFMICFESAFEQSAREARRAGADFLININNDIWLSGTTGMAQHPAHLVMRAIENRVGIAVAANTGYSGFVDPWGRFYGLEKGSGTAVVTGSIQTGVETPPYTWLGDLIGPTCVLLVLAALILAPRTSRTA